MAIALVVSDVDGTLVTDDKRLTPAAIEAVRRLDSAGIGFTLASSRPPVGLRHLAEALDLRLPLGAFNGSTVCTPDLRPISERLIPESVARAAAARLEAAGIDLWVFADGAWNLRDDQAPYTDLERRTLQTEPSVVPDLSPLLARAAKIVGVSRDHAGLARLEEALAAELEGRAAVHCSQPYYLDVTPPGIDKGSFVADLGRQLGIPRQRIATLGDAANDIALFRESGLSIAMGNAAPAVRQAASAVTSGNNEDGFARAINRFVFGDA
ncbi:Putative hydrolase, Cof-subfamily [Methylorubrum extorquens]|uniref:Hydrolase, Cof-subfamily n=1 Tax=Methylorubrum extorquens TaxID=408 RepID=A0A2N9ANH5_METEX|nr:Cof-type HAD-IIB family hydrolase [Methylorubrum zatmanii]ARO57078.1 hydrolase [Methylorubrum zatmanii]KQQ17432.1 hydrolase [Methylobacterium sp. Leaf121]SOR28843.1 Putative hydrolase, Cof-subfamily [Methylorubrum extorquens]